MSDMIEWHGSPGRQTTLRSLPYPGVDLFEFGSPYIDDIV